MTSRERVKKAFEHKQGDKVPVDFGGMCTSMVNALVVKELRDYFGLEKRPPKINDMSTMTAFIEPDLAEYMGCDIQHLYNFGDTYGHRLDEWKEWEYKGEAVLIPKNCTINDDGKGGYYVYPEGDDKCAPSGHMPAGSFYFDNLTRTPEFDEDEANPEDNAEDYMPVSEEQIAFHKKKLEELLPLQKFIQVAPAYMGLGDANNIPGANLKNPKGIRDITEWYTAPLLYPEYVHEVFELGVERSIENLKRYWKEFGDQIDILYICGADFGTQRGPLIDPKYFTEFYLPYYKKLNDWIHENTTWYTLKHSCGSINQILPDLIKSGFDAINPVQCSAEGMEPRYLKETFGKDIVFWGGGVDTQKVLPFGTPAEVREQVLERLDIFSKDGGYIFNSIHNIQANTPTENIIAMLDAVKEFNGEK